MKPLAPGYRSEVDSSDLGVWYEQLAAFSDASVYQLSHHASGFSDVSRLLLKRDDAVVAAAEVRLFHLPVLKGGIAYVFWGPVWRRRGHAADPEVFTQALRALQNEFVGRRGMVLRINPRLVLETDTERLAALTAEGFEPVEHLATHRRSLILDLSPPLETLRSGLDKKWRNCLSKAERSGLTVTADTSLESFDAFTSLYEVLLQRKQFAPTADIAKHRRIQSAVPAHLKMGVVLASLEGEACAGALFSGLGDTGLYLFGATTDTGLRTNASYLVQWEVVRLLKEAGVSHYDLNGANPDTNPGTYHFKKGLAGKTGAEVTFGSPVQSREPSFQTSSVLMLERLKRRFQAARNRSAAASV
jgi:lipid II:glycine glycyltransferase (peptidoglycan interpeptide bridge formation enzyme)